MQIMTVDINQVRERLATFMSAHGEEYSQSKIAHSIGKSPAVVNQFLAGKYQGNNKEIARRVQEFMDLEVKRAKEGYQIPFVFTSATKRIYDALEMAAIDRDICVITGDAGYGKTQAVRAYADEKDAILVEADPGYTPTALLKDICRSLALAENGVNQKLMQRIIMEKPEKLLIIDEAENLPIKALETVRRVHDKAGLAVALVGMDRLKGNLRAEGGKFKQLWSRVGIHIKVGKLTAADADKIIAASPYHLDITDKGRKALDHYSGMNCRILVKLLRQSYRVAHKNGRSIDEAVVATASEYLLI